MIIIIIVFRVNKWHEIHTHTHKTHLDFKVMMNALEKLKDKKWKIRKKILKVWMMRMEMKCEEENNGYLIEIFAYIYTLYL